MTLAFQSNCGGVDWQLPSQRLLRFVYQTSAISRHLRRLLTEAGAEWNLSDTEVLILWQCSLRGATGVVQGELAAELGISAAQMSALVDRLRIAGLLCFERSPLDRRRQVWRVNPSSHSMLQSLNTAIAGLAEWLGQRYSDEDQQHTEALHARLIALLQTDNSPREVAPGAIACERGAA